MMITTSSHSIQPESSLAAGTGAAVTAAGVGGGGRGGGLLHRGRCGSRFRFGRRCGLFYGRCAAMGSGSGSAGAANVAATSFSVSTTGAAFDTMRAVNSSP